jgi:hypothetical protein
MASSPDNSTNINPVVALSDVSNDDVASGHMSAQHEEDVHMEESTEGGDPSSSAHASVPQEQDVHMEEFAERGDPLSVEHKDNVVALSDMSHDDVASGYMSAQHEEDVHMEESTEGGDPLNTAHVSAPHEQDVHMEEFAERGDPLSDEHGDDVVGQNLEHEGALIVRDIPVRKTFPEWLKRLIEDIDPNLSPRQTQEYVSPVAVCEDVGHYVKDLEEKVKDSVVRVVDLCAGSGALTYHLLNEPSRQRTVLAIEIDATKRDHLSRQCGAGNVFTGDWNSEECVEKIMGFSPHIIVCNPPFAMEDPIIGYSAWMLQECKGVGMVFVAPKNAYLVQSEFLNLLRDQTNMELDGAKHHDNSLFQVPATRGKQSMNVTVYKFAFPDQDLKQLDPLAIARLRKDIYDCGHAIQTMNEARAVVLRKLVSICRTLILDKGLIQEDAAAICFQIYDMNKHRGYTGFLNPRQLTKFRAVMEDVQQGQQVEAMSLMDVASWNTGTQRATIDVKYEKTMRDFCRNVSQAMIEDWKDIPLEDLMDKKIWPLMDPHIRRDLHPSKADWTMNESKSRKKKSAVLEIRPATVKAIAQPMSIADDIPNAMIKLIGEKINLPIFRAFKTMIDASSGPSRETQEIDEEESGASDTGDIEHAESTAESSTTEAVDVGVSSEYLDGEVLAARMRDNTFVIRKRKQKKNKKAVSTRCSLCQGKLYPKDFVAMCGCGYGFVHWPSDILHMDCNYYDDKYALEPEPRDSCWTCSAKADKLSCIYRLKCGHFFCNWCLANNENRVLYEDRPVHEEDDE